MCRLRCSERVYIDGPEKTVSLDHSLLLFSHDPHILVKKATIFWNYNNVLSLFNNTVRYGNATITLPEGYYTYKELEHELVTNNDITMEMKKSSGKRSILGPTDDIRLGKLGELLGFQDDKLVITANSRAHSPQRVDVSRGLRYVEISCSIVDRNKNTNTHGTPSDVISSLAIPADTLKGSVTQYNDIESRVRVNKGVFNEITFKVRGNNETTEIGSILLECYIG